MRRHRNKRGATLIELLAYILIVTLSLATTFSAIITVVNSNKKRTDDMYIKIMMEAVEMYKWTDMSSAYMNNGEDERTFSGKIVTNNGVILSQDERTALQGSGLGNAPSSKDALRACIKAYTGWDKIPTSHSGKGFCWDKEQGKIIVYKEDSLSTIKYIELN